MRLRGFLLGSRAGRTLCVLLLLVFVVLCGLHVAGTHHDGDGDSLGLVADIMVVVALAAALTALLRADLSRAPAALSAWSSGHRRPPLRPPISNLFRMGALLRC